MSAYKHYWLLSALLMSAAIYAGYAGLFTWTLQKFPEPMTQYAFLFVALMFLWTFVRGHRTARMISRNERALHHLEQGDSTNPCEIHDYLEEAVQLRNEGITEAKQSDFSMLHQRQVALFDEAVTENVSSIDTMKSFMFIFAVFLAFMSIVSGVGLSVLPNSAEELRPFAFGLLKALGLAYVPGTACIGSFLILHVLGSMLHVHAQRLRVRFDLAVYRVAIIGRDVAESLTGGSRVSK